MQQDELQPEAQAEVVGRVGRLAIEELFTSEFSVADDHGISLLGVGVWHSTALRLLPYAERSLARPQCLLSA